MKEEKEKEKQNRDSELKEPERRMEKEGKKWVVKLAAAAVMVCLLNVLVVYWMIPTASGAVLGLKYGLVFAAGLILAQWFQRRYKGCWKAERAYQIVVGCLTPFVAFYACEMMERDSAFEIGAMAVLANYLLYALLFSLIRMIVRKKRWSAVIFLTITLGFSLTNYYVTEFRGTPLSPMDLFAWRTAFSVAGGYLSSFFLTKDVVIAVEIAAFWIYFSREEEKGPGVLRERGFYGVCAAVSFGMVIAGGFLDQSLDLWDLQNNIRSYGVVYQLAIQLSQSKMKKPEGYDRAALEAVADEYNERAAKETGTTPDIIVVMNESFADLQGIRYFETSEPCLEHYHALTENTIKGKAYVSIFGGATCNTEYEFLTGNSLAFLPSSAIPFQQYVNSRQPSVLWSLKERGYETVGIHPYERSSWNRAKVYENLGMDQFVTMEDFPEESQWERDLYISDKTSYEMVIRQYEQIKANGNPAFIFNVTMQNHGGYLTGNYAEDELIRIVDAPGAYPDAEEYLTSLKSADAAIPVLTDYFSQVQDPVVIVFFGDHQPGLSSDFYEFLFGNTQEERSYEEELERHQVPFFIWTNFDIDEANQVLTAPCFLAEQALETAGAKLSPYLELSKDVQSQVQTMSNRGYMDQEGVWHGWHEMTPILERYQQLQYNQIFEKKKLLETD